MKKCGFSSYLKGLSKGCNLFTCIASAVLLGVAFYVVETLGIFQVVKNFEVADYISAIIPAVLGLLILIAVIVKGVKSKTISATDYFAVIGVFSFVWYLVSAIVSVGSELFVLKLVTSLVLLVVSAILVALRVKFFQCCSETSALESNASFIGYVKEFVKKRLIFAVLFSALLIVGIVYIEKANFVAEMFNEQNLSATSLILLAVGIVYTYFFVERNKEKSMNFIDVTVFALLSLGVTFGVYTYTLPASTKLVAGAFAIFAIIVSILMFALIIRNTHLLTNKERAQYKKAGLRTYFTALSKRVNVLSMLAVALLIAGVISMLLLTNSVSLFLNLFSVHNEKALLTTIVSVGVIVFVLLFADVCVRKVETIDFIMVATAIVSLVGLIVDQLVMKQSFMLGGLFFTAVLALSVVFIAIRMFAVKLLPETANETVCNCTEEIVEVANQPAFEEVVAQTESVEVAVEETVATVEPELTLVEEETPIKQKRVNVKKSFEIYLRTGDEQLKDNYSAIKNEFLSYGVHARMTKARENFSKKGLSMSKANPEKNSRLQAKLLIRGKFLKLYINVDPQSIDAKYFRIKDVSDKMPDQATYIKVRSKLSLKRALELIALLAEKEGFKKKKKFEAIDYKNEYKDDNLSYMQKLGYDYMVKESVTYDEVLAYKEEWAERAIKIQTLEKADRYIYDEVSLDDLAKVYNDGDVITLESLREKELIKINCNHLTVKPSKELRKKLYIEAHEIDLKTAQMVIIAGGEVTRLILN